MSPASGGFRKRGPAPTARDTAPAYAPCPACGQPVLAGETRTGTRLALDVHVQTYCVLWTTGAVLPVLEQSRGYPVHRCQSEQRPGRHNTMAASMSQRVTTKKTALFLGDLKVEGTSMLQAEDRVRECQAACGGTRMRRHAMAICCYLSNRRGAARN